MSASTATATDAQDHAPETAHAPLVGVLMQVSIAFALVLLVRDLLSAAPLDRALMTSAGAGVVLYVLLVGGYFVVRHILDAPAEAPTPASETESASPSGAPEPSSPSSPETVAA